MIAVGLKRPGPWAPRALSGPGKERTMSELATKKCKPCEGETQPLQGSELERFLSQVEGWSLVSGESGNRIEKEYRFPDFVKALAFVNRLGEVAEAEGHHPDVFLTWGKVKINLWTHSIGGLSENDFILAAKADAVL
jgi:4a-hydroxytetrahydrobiopterin dehydratase